MPRQRDFSDLSQLEREFELEMDDGPPGGVESELEEDSETDEDRLNETLEEEFEQDEEAEMLLESSGDFADGRSSAYVERLLELSAREFESESEVDSALNEVLDDMEREYFFGRLKSGLKKLSKNRILRSLAQKGLKAAGGKLFPGLQGALQLARGNLKGALLNFGKQALGTVVPGGTAALDALQAVGLGGSSSERETWENYVELAREAYEHLADNVTVTADRPVEAIRLASSAVQHALQQAQTRAAGGRSSRRNGAARPTRVVRLRVAPGERVKLLIVGG